VIQAGAIGNGGEIFVLDMGEPVCIADLARDLIRHSGLRPDVDIDIEYIGMRPGEKLVEELHFHDEPQSQTIHPKIVVAECRAAGRRDIRAALSRLMELATLSPDEVPAELEQIVPEYRPNGERSIQVHAFQPHAEPAPQLLRRSA